MISGRMVNRAWTGREQSTPMGPSPCCTYDGVRAGVDDTPSFTKGRRIVFK